jgi:murein DD-endopeptidase MepM/ murein hydrolase activator NlpD
MMLVIFDLLQNRSFGEVLLRTIPPERIGTGKTLVTFVQITFPVKEMSLSFMGNNHPVFPIKGQSGSYWAFLGIPLKSKPDLYQLRLSILSKEGRAIQAQKAIAVSVTPYPEERITIAPKKRHLLTSKALKEEGKLLSALFSKKDREKRWSGQFILPVNGRFTSPFGNKRVYNDGKASWQHKGIDLAANDGARIVAPNSGKIVLARSLTAHGKTLVIDHGQGVFSVMIHLKDFAVGKGHVVGKGDLIGYAGKTGMANAPHLHWGLSVGNVRVNPLEWTEKSMERPNP